MSTSSGCPCPVFSSSTKCDQDALKLMEEFREFYEGKMNEIDLQGGGDCLEMKLRIQRRWIEDLTEQTQMMARIVKELEDEATTRVKMLEDKLRQTSKSAYEVMKRYHTYSISHLDEPFQKMYYLESDIKNLLKFLKRVREEKRWSIDGLHFYDVTYRDLFGDKECPCNDRNTCEIVDNNNLKETSCTEFLDQQMKKKNEEFEEFRQSMLDMRNALTEEVACKHDMISALKKDVLQLEERCVQSDKQTAFKDDIIKELRKEIKQLKHQIKEREDFMNLQLAEAHMKLQQMRPCVDMISICTEIDDSLCPRTRERELECQVDSLNIKCCELEKTLRNACNRAENLQRAVDLYINSINVLEASEERSRIEIVQQKMTIANLQEALVNVKQELDEVKQNSQQEITQYQYLSKVFYVNLMDLEEQQKQMVQSYKTLQDCTFDLEVEHFNSLQDLAMLETQLYKYLGEYRIYEETKTDLKKLKQQNRYYENVCTCFKSEMTVMAEQLAHLQEILNLSNQSCRDESAQLQNAVLKLQKLSDKLQEELVDTEKQVLIENQKNQVKEAKICELQMIIGQKNADLNVHDEAINTMKRRLENALMENQELQTNIAGLNSTLVALQCSLQNRDCDRAKRRCRSKSVSCKRSLSECSRYDNNRCEDNTKDLVKTLQRELDKSKDKYKDKIVKHKRHNEELKEKLACSELTNQRLIEKTNILREENKHLSQKDCCREHELSQSRQIIIEMRQALIEMNESLAETECHNVHESLRCREQEDIYISTKCEIVLYKKLTEKLKEVLHELRRQLKESDHRNRSLNEELRNRSSKKDKEACDCIEQLKERLRNSEDEVDRLNTFIDKLKEQVKRKIEEKEKQQSVASRYCDCDKFSSTQDEINSLKVEIKSMIANQLALNTENDKLLKQVTSLQNKISSLEEKNKHLKHKNEKLQGENDKLKEKNKTLERQKETWDQTVRTLEMELADTKVNRDDICAESKNVVTNVKAWLEEQKKINDEVKKKTQCYCNTISKLKKENKSLLMACPFPTSPGYKPRGKPCSPYDACNYFNGMGSQGTSPTNSPTCSVEEWYSPNYRDDDETDAEHDFASTLQTMTQEMRDIANKGKTGGKKRCECSTTKNKF